MPQEVRDAREETCEVVLDVREDENNRKKEKWLLRVPVVAMFCGEEE
jgi:hypothetical protein